MARKIFIGLALLFCLCAGGSEIDAEPSETQTPRLYLHSVLEYDNGLVGLAYTHSAWSDKIKVLAVHTKVEDGVRQLGSCSGESTDQTWVFERGMLIESTPLVVIEIEYRQDAQHKLNPKYKRF